jgi:outer membrane lipoprotein SlyB/predicted small lipoprotein YifL
MNIVLNRKSLSLLALMSVIALAACSQKPTSEEIAAQVKIALAQEKAKEQEQAHAAEHGKKETPARREAEQARTVAREQPAMQANATPRPYEQPVAQRPVCANCAVVVEVNVMEEEGKGSALGVIGGGVVGGLLGNQVGNGTGRDLATLAGAVGGAFAGNAIEKNAKKTKSYYIAVRMEDGTERTYRQPTDPGLTRGDKVKIENNMVVRN